MIPIFAIITQTASSLPSDASVLESSISALKSSISALESSIDSLNAWSEFCEKLLPWFTAAVVVGVVMELWVIWHDWREDNEDWALTFFGVNRIKHPSLRKLLVEIASVALVAGGVFGELAIGIAITSINGKLRSEEATIRGDNGQLVALIGQEAANANERATQDEKDAARLRKDAEDEHAARVEEEESVAWRSLTTDEQKRLRRGLEKFSVPRTWFAYNLNDPEAFRFGTDIATALSPLHWNPTEPEPIMAMREGPVPLGTNPPLDTGVVISTTGGRSNEDAADALTKRLIALGFDCKRSSKPALNAPEYGSVVIVFIEPRPDGPQGNAKLRADARAKQKITSVQSGTP